MGELNKIYMVQASAERALSQAAANNPYLTGESVNNLKRYASELQKVTREVIWFNDSCAEEPKHKALKVGGLAHRVTTTLSVKNLNILRIIRRTWRSNPLEGKKKQRRG